MAHDGEEESTEGDSFFVWFESARSAVAAAVAGQRALAAEPWPDGQAISVRMGLHTGEAERVGGTLTSLDINRAARISAVAHGGQILASESTRVLVRDLPPDVRLRDLGPLRLKDLLTAEHVYAVLGDGLRADFPPPRTPDAHPNNLPTQVTTFVGRDTELAEAAGLLASTRLLTLTGPGGTGKTRLSIQLAASVSDDFPDGLFFVPLEPIRDPQLVAARIASTVGVAEGGARPIADSLADWLGDRQTLLVLDNFEQVVAAAPLVADILHAAPKVKVDRDESRGAPDLRRAGVSRPRAPDAARSEPAFRIGPAQRPRHGARVRRGVAGPVCGGAPLHRPGHGGPTGVRGHERERSSRRGHQRTAAWDAAGDRACRGPGQAARS